jgi:nucleoside-diphosphate-sugar epimerase
MRNRADPATGHAPETGVSTMLNVLFIGGTGQISLCCVEAALAAGHRVSVYNRGQTVTSLPGDVEMLAGRLDDDAAYAALGQREFDVVCQFIAFQPEQVRRDLGTFRGRTGQYIFISSASAYQKPVRHFRITEAVPLENPFWEYSRRKAACEQVLREQTELPYTIVRPSHTTRTRLPAALSEGDQGASRMLRGLPVIVHGDGATLWPVTRSEDFAVPFVRLFGNDRALSEYFHITTDHAFTWDEIYRAIGRGIGASAEIVHVASDTLIRYEPEWIGPVIGDKMYSLLFDNSKVKAVVGDFACEADIDRVLAAPCAAFLQRLGGAAPAPGPWDPLFDRIIAEQRALGGAAAVP